MLRSLVRNSLHSVRSAMDKTQELAKNRKISAYVKGGKRPWTEGYLPFRDACINSVIHDQTMQEAFAQSLPLPEKYGEFLDERVVELPWLLANLRQGSGRLLDAGSSLNFRHIVNHPVICGKDLTIVTLEPEMESFWAKRISYAFADMRELPFRAEWFDEVACISTLEHIGKDNTIYSANPQWRESNRHDYIKAAEELYRVTKPGGRIYITVPYGKWTDFGYYQQFDADELEALVGAFPGAEITRHFFQYEAGGWRHSSAEHCRECVAFNIHDSRYFNATSDRDYDPDFAACSRAIATLIISK